MVNLFSKDVAREKRQAGLLATDLRGGLQFRDFREEISFQYHRRSWAALAFVTGSGGCWT